MTARMPRIDRIQVDADGTLRSPAPTLTPQRHSVVTPAVSTRAKREAISRLPRGRLAAILRSWM